MRMICKQVLQYPPGVYHNVGDSFEVEEKDASILAATGFAESDVEAEETPSETLHLPRGRGRPRKEAT